jgi:hypothetical protein
VIPLKDTLPGTRSWVSVAFALLALAAGATRPLVAALAALVLFVAADGLARRTRPWASLLLGTVGAAAAVVVGLATDDVSAPWSDLGPLAAAGAASVVAVAHLLRAPRARILTLSLVPGAGGMIAVPVLAWAPVGIVLAFLLR